MTAALDPIDRRIVKATQAGLPLTPAPYAAVAEALGLTEAEVIARLASMQERGIVRRIAVAPNHYAHYLACKLGGDVDSLPHESILIVQDLILGGDILQPAVVLQQHLVARRGPLVDFSHLLQVPPRWHGLPHTAVERQVVD